MTVVLLAALAMFFQDLIAVPLTQAEARNRAHLAGLLDTLGWLVAITTTFLAVDTLQGNDFARKVAVVLAVSVANYVGTLLGTKLGKRWVKEDLAERVDRLEKLHDQSVMQDSTKGKLHE